jgi:hypothetical protein
MATLSSEGPTRDFSSHLLENGDDHDQENYWCSNDSVWTDASTVKISNVTEGRRREVNNVSDAGVGPFTLTPLDLLHIFAYLCLQLRELALQQAKRKAMSDACKRCKCLSLLCVVRGFVK